MIVATTPFIAGHRVTETKGQCFGLVVRSRGFSGNLIAGLRSLGGGEIKEYTSLLEDTRRQALDRLVKNATLMGANAVISMRFDSSELAGTMSEIVAYGTAVVVEPDAGRAAADRRVTADARPRPRERCSSCLGALMALAGPRRGERSAAGFGALWLTVIGVGIVARGGRRAPALSLGGGRPAVRAGRAGRRRAERAPSSRASGRPTSSSSTRRPAITMRVHVDPRTGERRYVAEG